MTQRKKLIEVALPLEAINRESAREKSIRHGHPSTLHLWWARRPLAACRAVLFASLVDDPSSLPGEFPTEELQEKERQRLFRIIEELVKWENSNNERVLDAARKEILKSTDGNPPPVLDPFCGGGSIPLEAQRLGLKAHGSDLNPVAVLITKALIEIPHKFAHQPPVNPESVLQRGRSWKGAAGLADDVLHYGKWMRSEAEKKIGHLYPTLDLGGSRVATVIAWLWARTVKCPNPACGAQMPLVRSFALSTKVGKERRLAPQVHPQGIAFDVRDGKAGKDDGTVRRTGAKCLVCGVDVELAYIRAEGRAGRMSNVMTSIVADDGKGRRYFPATDMHRRAASVEAPASAPDTSLPEKAISFRVQAYGMLKHRDLFTARQLVAMTTIGDLVSEVRRRVIEDARRYFDSEQKGLDEGGAGAVAYGDAVATYLGLAVSKLADYNCSQVTWSYSRDQAAHAFTKQALPMVWDFAEVNPFAGAAGDFETTLKGVVEAIENLPAGSGEASQRDARALPTGTNWLVSTDPPYYDNIGYADLSDFFYVWLRRSLGQVFPSLFSTLLVPKQQELIASQFRFDGDASKAQQYFETGFRDVFTRVADSTNSVVTIYYAFKQAEEESEGDLISSTGWETMLSALLDAQFSVVGTWPVRTERGARSVSLGTNALASSVVLVCRRRQANASITIRRDYITALKNELPIALKQLQHSNIAAVDLAQAAIGPGMAIFSRYARVIEADGTNMHVRSSLQLINQVLDEVLSSQESEYDADTQWAVAWFDQFGMAEGPFGDAETLSRAKNTSVNGLVDAGVLSAARGKVRLLAREELASAWDPTTDSRLTVWEVTQYLMRSLSSKGEREAAGLLRKLGGLGETARDLAYRLYAICERRGWTEEAVAYNSLVVAWPEISKLASEAPSSDDQMNLA